MSSESAPLLRKTRPTPNPLPWFQVSIVLIIQICEPLASQSIYPFINQLISELDITGGDERKVGYYAGLIESLFFAVQALTVLHWSRLSDRVGRKPVMLVGLLGLSISMASFGLSRTFWSLVISRCLCGLLNGNIGVIKSAMGEMTDSTNRAQVFSFIPVVWGVGCTLGPLIGGTLSKPSERFPSVFGGVFWKDYPYFLPCAVVASFDILSFVATLIFFKESLPQKPRRTNSEDTLVPQDELIPLRRLLVFPVIVSVANYASLSFLYLCVLGLIPLFFSMPLEIGGLGFDPATIGYAMGCYGAFTGIIQGFGFSKIVRRFGERRLFLNGVLAFLPLWSLFPIISCLAQRAGGVTTSVWMCISMIPLLIINMDMAFSCIMIYITASAPNRRSLGATNGLSQMTISTTRAIAPAMANSLFSLSVERNLLGGYAVYAILFVLSALALLLARRLPDEVWDDPEENDTTCTT